MKAYIIVLFALGLLTASACKKEDKVDALPKATQKGKNTFGCLIDGETFLPKESEWQIMQPRPREPLFTWYLQRQFDVLATGDGRSVFIRLPGTVRPGMYSLGDARPNGSYGECGVGSARYYTDSSSYTGQVQLSRFDTVAKVAAGTFHFTARDYQSGRIVSVTDGRFDVRLP